MLPILIFNQNLYAIEYRDLILNRSKIPPILSSYVRLLGGL